MNNRVALIGDNSVQYISLLIDIWNNGDCAVLIHKGIPQQTALKMMLTPETNLVKDVGMDSISLMMMVVSIENKFNIELPDEFLTEEILSKFSNIVTIVEELLKNKNK